MRDPVAFLLFVSLLAIVFPKGNEGYNQQEYEVAEASIKELFAKLDVNNDGYVDAEEFSISETPDYIKYAFKRYDVDGDGKLNSEEFAEDWLNYTKYEWLQSETL